MVAQAEDADTYQLDALARIRVIMKSCSQLMCQSIIDEDLAGKTSCELTAMLIFNRKHIILNLHLIKCSHELQTYIFALDDVNT